MPDRGSRGYRSFPSTKLILKRIGRVHALQLISLLSLLRSYGMMATSRIREKVKEMDVITSLGLTQTNLTEENTRPATKPTKGVAETETITNLLDSGQLGGRSRRRRSRWRREWRHPLSSTIRPSFGEGAPKARCRGRPRGCSSQAKRSGAQNGRKVFAAISVAYDCRLPERGCRTRIECSDNKLLKRAIRMISSNLGPHLTLNRPTAWSRARLVLSKPFQRTDCQILNSRTEVLTGLHGMTSSRTTLIRDSVVKRWNSAKLCPRYNIAIASRDPRSLLFFVLHCCGGWKWTTQRRNRRLA